MISQGFPLWAVESDGTAHAVVGWDEQSRTPYLIPTQGYANSAQRPEKGQPFMFTTTDPTGPAREIRETLDGTSLRARLGMRLDEIAKTNDADARWAAAQIRRELDK